MSQGHVLLTTDVVGGVWDFTLALARRLGPLGYRASILAIGEPSDGHRAAAADSGIPLTNASLKLEWMADGLADLEATRRAVDRTARTHDVDVVHANTFGTVDVNAGGPTILTVHSDVLSWRAWTLGDDGVPREWQAYADLVRAAVRHTSSVVAVSTFQAHEISARYGVNRQMEVIHNGWDGPLAPVEQSEQRTGTLLAGRIWDAAKNIGLAAEAASGWECGWIGVAGAQDHPDGGHATLPERFTALGHLGRDALDARLDRAAVYISPARYDPFGLLPLQAALHGCALVLADIPSYREIWGDAAVYFRSDDAAALRDCWQSVLASRQRRQMLARRATSRARQLSSTRMAHAYAQVYERLTRRVAA